MMIRILILTGAIVAAEAAEALKIPMDPRLDNPRYQPQVQQEPANGYEVAAVVAVRPADPEADALLERRTRVQAWLETVAVSGIDGLHAADCEQFVAQLGSDFLLLPEHAGEPFRILCVRALAKLQVPGWWLREGDRRAVVALLDVVAQAHVAGGKAFLDAFDSVGVFEPAAAGALAELVTAAPRAATFAELDGIDAVARQAYAILAIVGRAPNSTYQETPVYVAIIRRREALRP